MAASLRGARGRLLAAAILLAVVSPVFGVVLAERVGYHEPLDLAAEKLGLRERSLAPGTPFRDYSFPGLPPTVGYAAAGLLGIGVILAVGLAARAAAARAAGGVQGKP